MPLQSGSSFMKSRGIIYLAFGEEFDKITAATARYSRKFTDLPIRVLSNLHSHPLWKNISNVSFTYIPLPTVRNREVKVSLIDYSPFEESLFLDSDALIQRPNIESVFRYLLSHDIVCSFYRKIRFRSEPSPCYNLYAFLALHFNEKFPIPALLDSAFLFRKSKTAQQFFLLWKKLWVFGGSSRDMPAFSFTARHSSAKVKVFYRHSNICFCTHQRNKNHFIQHKGYSGFEKEFGLPHYKDWSPLKKKKE